ncbi:MAG: VCBS repeat-containing protein [Bacteroidota bacterium]
MLLFGCQPSKKPSVQEVTRFQLLTPEATGVTFRNDLTERTDFNIFNYMYFYNGGGVAVGDVNGDSLPDVYFTANQLPNKLYLNKGGLRFEDITDQAKVAGQEGWTTGVTMADVNGDGKLDVYVSQLGDHLFMKGHNQLFINLGNDENGLPQFEERAAEYGLDLVGYSTQAVFFDYDLDGDLDMYMLNHSVHDNDTFGKRAKKINQKHPTAGDRLLRNDDGKFTDVSAEAGIFQSMLGYGLGISVGDVNLDGYPDIYVTNDFHENDYLYMNQGDGTFQEELNDRMRHTSRFAMGNDIADYNNDGFPDLVALDMLPRDPYILKTSAAEDPYDIFHMKLNFGYNYQYARNTLQQNLGDGRFSEVGLMAGMAATDWSWSPLFADYDLDGKKDLFISNGILRRSNDLDYIKFISSREIQMLLEMDTIAPKDLALIDKMPQVKLTNFMFENKGGIQLDDVSESWGFSTQSYSNGAVYSDLDNDGDLDLVVNNVADPAFIYQNMSQEKFADQTGNYLSLSFEGTAPNTYGIGTKVLLEGPEGRILQEVSPVRGFQSSVDPRLLIGVGGMEQVPLLTVIWPDGTYEELSQVGVNRPITLKQSNAFGKFDYAQLALKSNDPLLLEEENPLSEPFVHQENPFVEFNREPLMPHMIAAEGPKLAIGDVNGDGLEDMFIGGSKRQSGQIYLQRNDGKFVPKAQSALRADSLNEDIGAAFLDVEQDGDLDLIVASGGNEFFGKSPAMLPRLYLNDGKGNFSRAVDQLPEIYLTASCVLPWDFDEDGDMDVVIGGRAVPWKYGELPQSYLLENDGAGNFSDVTEAKASQLAKAGFVKDAQLGDLDGDGQTELILAGEWMPLRIFKQENGQVKPWETAEKSLKKSNGWWNNVLVADLDGDGDQDFLAGNLGLNSKVKISQEEPLCMYVSDFDGNGKSEQVLCYIYEGERTLLSTKDEITRQLVEINKQYIRYEDYAQASFDEVFPAQKLDAAEVFYAYEFRSSWVENKGNGQFELHPLPEEVQIAPVKAAWQGDLQADGRNEVVLVGNFYEVNPQLGRYDASYGHVLRWENGNFSVIPNRESGFLVDGQCRDIKPLKSGDRTRLVIARNNDSPVFFQEAQPRSTAALP